MPNTAVLKFRCAVNAPVAETFRAFTHATALRDWLCNAAQTDARLGGRLYLWWEDGYSVCGSFTRFEPGKRLAFSWDGFQEPGVMQVQVALKEKGGATEVTITHGGLGTGPKWKNTRASLARDWPERLENLACLLETGVDLRAARRPRLGILIEDFNAEIAKKLGVPVTWGIRLAGTADATGARAAGLQKDDVIVQFNGQKVASPSGLGPALRELKAGDKPRVVFYRGPEKHTVPLELSRFPIPAVPATGAALAETVRQTHAEVDAALAQRLAGLSEAEAERRPAEGEWSVKELVAHFILTERDYQSWVADMLNDTPVNESLEFRPNVNPRIHALVKRLGSLDALRAELTRAEAETTDLLANLPKAFTAHRQHLYRRAALWVLEVTPGHWREEHLEQFQATIAAARAAGQP